MPRRGACLLCRLPTLPFRKPQGGLGGFGRLPALPLALFFAPIPPAPLPGGKGEIFCFLMQGASPLASPGLNPAGTYSPNKKRYPAGGLAFFAACLPCPSGSRRGLGGFGRLPALPLACFAAPYPPSPLPLWGRGRLKVNFAGGFAPGTPALDRLRHL